MLSATESIRTEQTGVDDPVTLIDQYGDEPERVNTIRFDQIVGRALPPEDAHALMCSDGWGAVTASLSRVETHEVDPAGLLQDSWNGRERGSADDFGAVLSYRMERRLDTVPVFEQTIAMGTPGR